MDILPGNFVRNKVSSHSAVENVERRPSPKTSPLLGPPQLKKTALLKVIVPPGVSAHPHQCGTRRPRPHPHSRFWGYPSPRALKESANTTDWSSTPSQPSLFFHSLPNSIAIPKNVLLINSISKISFTGNTICDHRLTSSETLCLPALELWLNIDPKLLFGCLSLELVLLVLMGFENMNKWDP